MPKPVTNFNFCKTFIWRNAVVATASLLVSVCFAGEWPSTNAVAVRLHRCPPPELPAEAAALVVQADRLNRSRVAVEVLHTTARLNPAALVAVVGSVIKAAPETDLEVVKTAGSDRPDLVVSIARAAVGAHPAHVRALVAALCQVSPSDERTIVLAAAQTCPGAGSQILRGAGDADPELRPYLEAELARAPRSNEPISRRFDAALRQRGLPAVGQAGQPRPTWPPGQSGGAPPRGDPPPPGGRNYARP